MVDKIILFFKDLNERQILILLIVVTFGLRLYAVLMAQGMAYDSAAYGFMARDFIKGDWIKGLSSPAPPFYPLLIFLFSPDSTSVEMIGRWISLACGTFAVIPMFYLVKQEIGQKEGILSAVFYSIHPYLVTYSGMLLTEATYWGLLILSVYFFWTGLKKESAWRMALSGCFLGLAYLTRPEGIGYVLVYLLWILVRDGLKKKWLKKIILIGALILTVLIFVVPYILYIHQETGQWLISKKGLGTQSQLFITGGEEGGASKSLGQRILEQKNSQFKKIIQNVIQFFPFVVYHYLRAYHFSLWVFLIFGFICVRRKIIAYELFIASLVLFHLFSLSTFVPSTIRFAVPLIPLSLFWASEGILKIKSYLEKFKIFNPERVIFLLLLCVMVIQLPQGLKPERGHRTSQKTVGLWLKQNTPSGTVIMSNSPQEVFYAEREFIMFPSVAPQPEGSAESYQEIIRYVKNRGVRYILVNKNTQETNPGFMKSIQGVDLKEIYKKSEESLMIYEVIY
jgi:hypothetical protein